MSEDQSQLPEDQKQSAPESRAEKKPPQSTSARGQRRGFYWQDWYAAWTMLRCVAEPSTGIVAVGVEVDDSQYIDDVVEYYRDRVVFRQLKHTTHEEGKYTGSDLFSGSGDSLPLIAKLYSGWEKVRQLCNLPIEVRLTTNAAGSDDSRNKLISPVNFVARILTPARSSTWFPDGHDQAIYDQIRNLVGNPSENDYRQFLAALHLDFEEPSENQLEPEVVRLLNEHLLRSKATASTEAEAWLGRVYKLATQPEGAKPLSRQDIEHELRLVTRHHRRTEHILALPEHHVPRREVADEIVRVASELGEGYLRVVGPPGCGKTTLATWVADNHQEKILLRYHVFDPTKASRTEIEARASSFHFINTMIDVLSKRFPEVVIPAQPSRERLADAVGVLRDTFAHIAQGGPRIVIIDGIDHVVRARLDRETLFDALPHPVPAGVVFLLFGQPGWNYPDWLLRSQKIDVPPFTSQETRNLVLEQFGWQEDDTTATTVADILHDRSAGNPLSLFYNLSLAESLGDNPGAVTEGLRSARLFGANPHDEYDRLLVDLKEIIPVPRESRSLKSDLLSCIAVATAAVTVKRLSAAFAVDGLTERQALDFLEGLRPVVVERSPRCFWVFHDDFRRYIEERTDELLLKEAHARFAQALEEDWSDEELGALVEHCYRGERDAQLAQMPAHRDLHVWLSTAAVRDVLLMHRLALVAALRLRDDTGVMRNALAAARAFEAVDLEELTSTDQDLRKWSFVVPPMGVGTKSLKQRAQALQVAARWVRSNWALANQIAARFIISLDRLPTPGLDDSPEDDDEYSPNDVIQEYIKAHASWLLRSGQLIQVKALVGERQFSEIVITTLADEFLDESDDEVLIEWTKNLAGLNGALDRAIVRAAMEHLIGGRERTAALIADVMIAVPTLSRASRRDAAVLLSLCEGKIHDESRNTQAGVQIPLQITSEPMSWRDFFFHGFATTASNPTQELGVAEFPPRFIHVFADEYNRASRLQLARFFWQTGCATGLALHGGGMLSAGELERIVHVLTGTENIQLEPLDQHTLHTGARIYLPMLARAVRGVPALAQAMRTLVVQFCNQHFSNPSIRLTGILEAIWVLDPEAWRGIARRAHMVEFLPDTESDDRIEWFEYWLATGDQRGVPAPADFRQRASIARLGVPSKTDPAALAVDLISHECSHHDAPTWVRRLAESLIRLNREPDGSRAARRHLHELLALALSMNPALFEDEFNRCAVDHDVGEPFGELPGEVTAAFLKSRPALSIDDLFVLWHWMVAAPGSFQGDSDGRHATMEIIERLTEAGATAEVELIHRWMDHIASPLGDSPSSNTAVDPGPWGKDADFPISSVHPWWFSPYFYGREHRFLNRFLESGGDAAWSEVCTHTGAWFEHEPDLAALHFLCVGEGLPALRPRMNRPETIEIALTHLAEKVRFQPPPDPPAASSGGKTILDVIVGLLVRGMDVSDVETVRRTLRSVAALSRRPGTRDVVRQEMENRLTSEEPRTVRMALLILRHSGVQVPTDLLRRLNLDQHPDAWCRHLACRLLGVEPQWSELQTVITGTGLVTPSTKPDQKKGSALYYSDPIMIKNIYLRKLDGLVKAEDHDLRAWLETEYFLLPERAARPVGWHDRPGARIFSTDRVAEAAGRLVTRLASTVPEGKLPVLLATVASFDPWLVLAPPVTDPPTGWIEFCRTEKRTRGNEEINQIRSLGLIRPSTLCGPDTPSDKLIAEAACNLIIPKAPRDYAWVTEYWPAFFPPTMDTVPVVPLAFLNKIITELQNDRFGLVPMFGHPPFQELTFEVADVPRWVHPSLGPVMVAAQAVHTVDRRGRTPSSEDGWNGWYASPAWLHTFLETAPGDDLALIRFWREETTSLENSRQSSDESQVKYGFEWVDLTP